MVGSALRRHNARWAHRGSLPEWRRMGPFDLSRCCRRLRCGLRFGRSEASGVAEVPRAPLHLSRRRSNPDDPPATGRSRNSWQRSPRCRRPLPICTSRTNSRMSGRPRGKGTASSNRLRFVRLTTFTISELIRGPQQRLGEPLRGRLYSLRSRSLQAVSPRIRVTILSRGQGCRRTPWLAPGCAAPPPAVIFECQFTEPRV